MGRFLTEEEVEKRKPKGVPAASRSRKGSPNKNTAAIKDMILQALTNVGGARYLTARAMDPKTQVAFLGLLGKVLPMQVTGADDGPLQHSITVEFVKAQIGPTT